MKNKHLEKHNTVFPSFKEKNTEGKWVEIKKPFTFKFLKPISEGSNGMAFGELALLNDKPRSATIITLEDTHFAILLKEDFQKIMAKSLKNRFASKVNFLDSFQFIQGLTKISKEKLSLWIEKDEYKLGQSVIQEGDALKYIYFIESGEFEVQKKIYLQQKGELVYGKYLRISSKEPDKDYLKIIAKNKLTYSDDINELAQFKMSTKMLQKKVFRLSIQGEKEWIGLAETKLNWKYSFFTYICHSRVGVLQ